MAEEEKNKSTITSDDVSVLRLLLHNIKGISTVSSSTVYAQDDVEQDES